MSGAGGGPFGDWIELGPGDLDGIHRLHRAAVAAVSAPGLIRSETRDFFAALLGGDGWLVGRRDAAGELCAYGVLQWALPPAEDLRPLLRLDPAAPFAKLAGCSVRPDLWGSGMQETMIDLRLAEAGRRGIEDVYSTSAPGNARSWANLMARGFAVRALIEQYGGHLRYILHRSVAAPRPYGDAAERVWIAAEEIAGQRAALAAGLIGCAWRRREDGGREILWSRPE